jgi:dihydroneopterin aldolase
MQDTIILEEIEAFCRLGIYESERQRGQHIKINLRLGINLEKADQSDNIKDTISYVDASRIAQETAQVKEYNLLEHLCAEICRRLLEELPKLENVEIKIHKPIIKADGFSGKASVCMERRR